MWKPNKYRIGRNFLWQALHYYDDIFISYLVIHSVYIEYDAIVRWWVIISATKSRYPVRVLSMPLPIYDNNNIKFIWLSHHWEELCQRSLFAYQGWWFILCSTIKRFEYLPKNNHLWFRSMRMQSHRTKTFWLEK